MLCSFYFDIKIIQLVAVGKKETLREPNNINRERLFV